MKITADIVKEMREKTGLAMIECKHFLNIANLDTTINKEKLIEDAVNEYFKSRKSTYKLIDYRKK